MACPECEDMLREYIIFRSAVARFAARLEDLERERVRLIDERRPPDAPPLVRLRTRLSVKAQQADEG